MAEAVNRCAGERVLDVAAGNGNATLAAARRFATVTSTDYVPQLLDKAAARAHATGLDVQCRVADAEVLPFADGRFDVARFTFGAMFAPDHDRTASELRRVVRPGGRIGLAVWTPDGFIGHLFRLVGTYVPPPAGIRSPVRRGDEPNLVELFGPRAADIQCTRRTFNFPYHSAHWIEIFRTYGPVHKAFAALDSEGQTRLHAELVNLLESRNIAGPSALVVHGDYLEAVVTRHGWTESSQRNGPRPDKGRLNSPHCSRPRRRDRSRRRADREKGGRAHCGGARWQWDRE